MDYCELVAKAVVAKLPHTADGVPVVPGMVVWFEYDDCPGEFGNDIVNAVSFDHMDHGDFSKCYSTKEAAEAARDNA